MTKPPSEHPIDSLDDSEVETRAKLAALRTERVNHSAVHKKSSALSAADGEDEQQESSYQNYLFGNSGSIGKPAWSDSMHGRAFIRLVSRGVVGAAFFAWGGRIARNQIRNYDFKENPKNLLQGIAKTIDIVAGKPIEAVAWALADTKAAKAAVVGEAAKKAASRKVRQMAAWESTDFRQKSYQHADPNAKFIDKHGNSFPRNGRSLGAEIVGVTFDFAMASVGDAMTRNIAQALDPNVARPWMVNDQGKMAKDGEHAHFDGGKWLKSVGRASWRIFSKNQGEDWAAAFPYVYQMKWQRQAITKLFKDRYAGWKLVFDNQWNGGAYRVNHDGKVVGDYLVPGAIDLHFRFIGYNWYTLMYRESYDAVNGMLNKWKTHGFRVELPDLSHVNPVTAVADAAGSTARYIAKSFIKANLYMWPSVVPFWVMRTTQSKWRGAYIYSPIENHKNPNYDPSQPIDHRYNAMMMKQPGQPTSHQWQGEPVFLYDTTAGRTPTMRTRFNGYQPDAYLGAHRVNNPTLNSPYDKGMYKDYATHSRMDRFEKGFSQVLNWPGKISYNTGSMLARWSDKLPNNGIGGGFKDFLGKNGGAIKNPAESRENFVRSIVDASFAYTPYMYAKAELGLRVDDRPGEGKLGQMDKAIYGLIDHVSSFNFKGVWDSGAKILDLATHLENEVKSREGHAVAKKTDAAAPPPLAVENEKPLANIQAKDLVNHGTHGRKIEANANDNHVPNANDNSDSAHSERHWAEAVAGRNLAAQFQAPTTTRQ